MSYILYMPMPESESWKPEWGGALELYPVKPGPDGVPEPENMPSKSIPPSWNQFIFFEIQPGHSFHSVEEVTVDEDDCQRQRLSISGWFHRAQEGEEGYEVEMVDTTRSSLSQLVCTMSLPNKLWERINKNTIDFNLDHIQLLPRHRRRPTK